MDFEHKMPEWNNEGTAPSTELKTDGFQAGYKPPAGVFNWFWSLIMKAIKEIQSNLSNVDNTKDSEKNVSFASEAGVGRKVKYPFIFRLNGGNAEGTDLWTYDGSTSRSVNLTPKKLGARPTEKPNIVVNAVREETDDGKEIYVVTDSNITELYNGLEITIIPNARNTTSSPRLKINDFEDNGIRLPLSFNCAATTTIEANYFQIDRPITLKYHSALNLGIQGQGAWIFADRQKTSAQDLYGSVPIENGGTGASTAADALKNLGISNRTQVYDVSTDEEIRNQLFVPQIAGYKSYLLNVTADGLELTKGLWAVKIKTVGNTSFNGDGYIDATMEKCLIDSLCELDNTPKRKHALFTPTIVQSFSFVDEWEIPPMVAGVEYRTAERYMGYPVHTTLIKAGTNDATESAVEFDAGCFGVSDVIDCKVIIDDIAEHWFNPSWLDIKATVTTDLTIKVQIERTEGTYKLNEAHSIIVVLKYIDGSDKLEQLV